MSQAKSKTTSQHTPTWHREHYSAGVMDAGETYISDGMVQIITVHRRPDPTDHARIVALVEQAPAMYKALRDLVRWQDTDYIDVDKEWPDIITAARAVLKEVDGE